MEGGTVYILQEFVFHVRCFCCPLHVFLVSGGGKFYCHNINLDNTWKSFKEIFFISVLHSRFALLEKESRVFLSFSFVTTAVCDSSFPLQDTVLAVSDLRQRVIARDQSDRSPVWPYVCYLLVTNLNIKYKFWENYTIHVILYMSVVEYCPICQGFQNTVCACLMANESSRLGWLL